MIISEDDQTTLKPELRPEYKIKLAKIIAGKHLSREALNK